MKKTKVFFNHKQRESQSDSRGFENQRFSNNEVFIK